MTRRGSRQVAWTTADTRYLANAAGKVPLRDICRHLKRSADAVKTRASRMGISLRVPVWGLVWCDECATWRTELSPMTGRCRVCDLKHATARHEAACAEVMEKLPQKRRALYASTEAGRGSRRKLPPAPRKPSTSSMGYIEAARAERKWLIAMEEWEYRKARLPYDAAKTRLGRMRRDLGISPRKKSK